MVRKLYPKSVTPDSANSASRSEAIAALTSTFEKSTLARDVNLPRSPKVSPKEDVKEGDAEDEEGLPIYPYERLMTSSTDLVTEIDVTRRETYLSSEEFKEKFGMTKAAFYKFLQHILQIRESMLRNLKETNFSSCKGYHRCIFSCSAPGMLLSILGEQNW
ncbi:Villin-4 [Abeliophyllum distichum]|uniref:Villin-4 n=1 Tax=Abeliophyllum distichum TaxID=126358 RepID=A0ABD1PTE0_9LAMI